MAGETGMYEKKGCMERDFHKKTMAHRTADRFVIRKGRVAGPATSRPAAASGVRFEEPHIIGREEGDHRLAG